MLYQYLDLQYKHYTYPLESEIRIEAPDVETGPQLLVISRAGRLERGGSFVLFATTGPQEWLLNCMLLIECQRSIDSVPPWLTTRSIGFSKFPTNFHALLCQFL